MGQIGPFGFQNSLNTNSSIFTQPSHSLSSQVNFRFIGGVLVAMGGASAINSTALPGGGIIHYVQGIIPNPLSPATYPFLAICDGKIYGLSSAGVATDISGSAAFATFSFGTANHFVADVLNGIMVISDASGTTGWLGQWSGSGNVTKLTTPPDAFVVKTCNNMLFAAIPNSSTVSWSNVSDPTTWNAASNITFRQGDGDSICALSYIGTTLYIFKNYSIGALSTTSQTVSGVVTLGPLSSVNVGIGACGNTSVDRLPDGRIIFLGSNGHAYIFDGSTLTDISDQEYPATNVQTLFDSCAPISRSQSFPSVVVYPVRHEAWFILTPNPLTSGLAGVRIGIYDYLNNFWSDGELTSNTLSGVAQNIISIAYVPTHNSVQGGLTAAGAYGLIGNMVASYPGGYLYTQDVSPVFSADSGDGYGPATATFSISLSGEGKMFLPRSILIEHKDLSILGNNMTVQYAFDGAAFGSAINLNLSTSSLRSIVPLSLPSTGQSSVGPSTIQIKITATLGQMGSTIAPFYLSDEVMN